eukprot:1849023-Alexandrium_andersonii.AAC.1
MPHRFVPRSGQSRNGRRAKVIPRRSLRCRSARCRPASKRACAGWLGPEVVRSCRARRTSWPTVMLPGWALRPTIA